MHPSSVSSPPLPPLHQFFVPFSAISAPNGLRMRAFALLESQTRRGSGRSKEREWKNTSGGGRRRAGNGGSGLEHTHQQGQNVSVVHRSTRGWPLGRHAGASCAACGLSAGVVRVREEATKRVAAIGRCRLDQKSDLE